MESTNELKYTVEKPKTEDLKSMAEVYNSCSEFLIERNEDYFKNQIEKCLMPSVGKFMS